MSATISKLEVIQGDGFRIAPDDLLEAAKGKDFATLLIAGQLPDGSIWLSGTDGVGETLILLEKAKHQTIFGEPS